MKFEVRHTLHTDIDTFWNKLFFDEAYNRRMYIEGLKFDEYKVLSEEKSSAGVVTRRVHLKPKDHMPAIIHKVIGDSIVYTEEGTFDPKTKRYAYRVVPSRMADKVTTQGEFWVEPLSERSVTRICTVDLNVKIFGVGGTIEHVIKQQTVDNYEHATSFTNQYIKEMGW